MKFRDFVFKNNRLFDEMNEDFDTSVDIIKVDKIQNVERHYFNIKYQYRIFVETVDNDIHFGFEVYNNGWTTDGIIGNLSTQEVLKLFGTVLKVLKKQKFKNLMICSNEYKKFRLYLRMVGRLQKELELKDMKHNDSCIFIGTINSNSFKYKGKND